MPQKPIQPAGFVPDGFIPDGFVPDSAPVNVGGAAEFSVNGAPVRDVGDAFAEFGGGLSEMINPLHGVSGALKQLYDMGPMEAMKALGRAPADFGRAIGTAQRQMYYKAREAWKRGDVGETAQYTAAWLVPLVGPAVSSTVDLMKEGNIARASGQLAGLVLPWAIGKASAVRGMSGMNRAEATAKTDQAAAAAMLDRGVPVDLGTVTGNRFVRGAQALSENTPLGSVAERSARMRRSAAMERLGRELADEGTPGLTATPETAGQVVREGVQGRVEASKRAADEAYTALRELEGEPWSERTVITPRKVTPPAGTTVEEAAELQRMLAELEEVQYSPRTWTKVESGRGEQATNYDITPGNANAPVYREIIGDFSPVTAKKLRNAIDAGLSGRPTVWYERSLEIARRRLAGKSNSPMFPPGSGGKVDTALMQAPVDLRAVKSSLAPLGDELRQTMAALRGAPSQMRLSKTQQGQAEALVILDELAQMPDYAPVSAVDAALSNLKRIVRGADTQWSRSRQQGIAAKAVGELETAVQSAVEALGPTAVELRNAGRAATVAKYEALETLKRINKEPVKAYNALTAQGDTNLAQLRQVEKLAPGTAQVVGRAFLEELMAKATETGTFDLSRGAGVAQQWEKLGSETKRLMFPNPSHRQSLDQFFLMSRRMSQGPNPSGTALVAASGAAGAGLVAAPLTALASLVGTGAMVTAFHNPTFVRMVVRALDMQPGSPRQASAFRSAANVAAKAQPITASVGRVLTAGAVAEAEQRR